MPDPLEARAEENVVVREAQTVSESRTWPEQHARMMRAHKRATAATAATLEAQDDYYNFFASCYHLKDWLKNDPSVPAAVGSEAETLFDSATHLRVCADLANGIKHLRATRHTRIDPDSKLAAEHAAYQPDAFQSDAFQTQEHIVVVAASQSWDVREVADACIAAWDAFLRERHLM